MPRTHKYDPVNCATGGDCGEAPDHPIHFYTDPYPMTVITAEGTYKGRLTEEDVVEVTREAVLTPNYEQTAKFLGQAICEGSHEKPAAALAVFAEHIRYLAARDPEATQRVIDFFNRRQERLDAADKDVDAHLESDYEDRFGYPDES